MALFKVSKGTAKNLPATLTEGYCWYTYDNSKFYIDFKDENGVLFRKALNAHEAEKLTGYDIATILNSSDVEIPTSAAVLKVLADKADANHNHDDRYYTESEVDGLLNGFATEDYVDSAVSTNYGESIIGLSIDGQVITYIKGDGTSHTIVTQDTNTTYSLGTDETTGLTKLYATTGSAEDGTMTQKAIKTELDKKVGVSMDSANATLIFTI